MGKAKKKSIWGEAPQTPKKTKKIKKNKNLNPKVKSPKPKG